MMRGLCNATRCFFPIAVCMLMDIETCTTTLHSTAHHSAAQRSLAQRSPAHSTAQHIAQHNTSRHSKTPYEYDTSQLVSRRLSSCFIAATVGPFAAIRQLK